MNIREKILVIEDEKSIARFISTILTANGYEAMRAASGAEAMSMISSHCPDLVILDLMMPFMDGMPCLREMPRRRLSPAARAAQRSIRWPQLFEGGAQTAPRAAPGAMVTVTRPAPPSEGCPSPRSSRQSLCP